MKPSGAMTERRLELLRRLAETGSILRAARASAMSWRGAWLAIDAMNSAAPAPLVERRAGGKGGGGTRLTPAGRRLLEDCSLLAKGHAAALKRSGSRASALGALGWLRRLAVRTSARNQLFGRVVRVRPGPVNAEVLLALKGGDRLTAVITKDSLEELALRRGSEAFALVKATWVVLAGDGPEPRVSARNRYRGTVERVVQGAVSAEIDLRLRGGDRVSAVITKDSARELGLARGRRAWALFKASSVILGVQA